MVELEIDGQKVEIIEGSTVMHAATKLGLYVPHFCYHKKLSIAANCRMCLVEVEKAPKPLPACATPVAQGMKVFTKSEKAITAQKGVMEFLLINHPLDCPICDQGGECQLQDLAVGYGGSSSHFSSAKRVVFHKPMGPLISAQEMSRCIHCTRCVRFGQEVAGVMELGMTGRGEHSEIMSFVGRSISSELSGNMIDVCPVGALTSKPFRYSARTWELSRRKSISAHDSLGSNLTVQVKANKVMRVLPLENESVNECWLSDRDRFAYEGLNSPDRLIKPMIKQNGEWAEVDWQSALDYAAHALSSVAAEQTAQSIGFLGSGTSTLEELSLLKRLAHGMGSDSVDFRPRQTDFTLDAQPTVRPWLGMQIADVAGLDRLLVIGATLRQEQPLLTARIRQAAKRGLKLFSLHGIAEDLLIPSARHISVAPSYWLRSLSQVAAALHVIKGLALPSNLQMVVVDSIAQNLAEALASGKAAGILLGNAALHHPQMSQLLDLCQVIANVCGGKYGVLGDCANAVGGYIAGAYPQAAGKNASTMFTAPMSAYLLLNIEPTQDCANPVVAAKALTGAKTVIALTAFRTDDLLATADCLLPVTPFTETAGTFISTEGRVQSFQAVVKPLGEARPAWKVLRVIANLLKLDGFDEETAEQVRQKIVANSVVATATTTAADPVPLGLNNAQKPVDGYTTSHAAGIERLAYQSGYRTDATVRRSACLQETHSARASALGMRSDTIQSYGLTPGQPVRIRQLGFGQTNLVVEIDDRLAPNTVRVDAARDETATLGPMFGDLIIEKLEAETLEAQTLEAQKLEAQKLEAEKLSAKSVAG